MTSLAALSGSQCTGPMLGTDVPVLEAVHGEGRQAASETGTGS